MGAMRDGIGMRWRLLPVSVFACAFSATLLHGTVARAQEDCPPGSVHKAQDGFTWCEPTVCENDSQCTGGEVCRPVALCVQVGTVTKGDTGQRLVVTQRCAPDKKCPATTVCSDMGRCVPKAVAEKMGLTNAPAASASAAPSGTAAKKSCGCDVPGAKAPGTSTGIAAFFACAIVAIRRRRPRRSRRRSGSDPIHPDARDPALRGS
jgi:hypothetical protein